jgi:2-methylcitrate dehydratase PrpD
MVRLFRVDSRGVTGELAAFIASWRPDALPPVALVEARRSVLDTLGVALVGSIEQSGRIAAGVARRHAAAGAASVIGHGFRCASSFAAFVNGVSAHALDYDASATVKTTGHPLVCVVPAALAAAEEADASGRELIEAVIVGFEIVSRLGGAAGGDRGNHYTSGFHGTSVFGIFGATAAAGRIMRLDHDAVCHAIGIAASGPKGVRANYGTMSKPLHVGEASRAGVMAATLAGDGFTASPAAIEAPFGWAQAVVSDSFQPDLVTERLGTDLAIERGVNFKRFPSCGASHAPIRATFRLLSEHELHPEDIAELEVSMAQEALDKTLVFTWPSQPLEGKFCAPYVVAAAWADGRVGVDSFTTAKMQTLEDYRARVHVLGLDGRPDITVVATLQDGRKVTSVEPGNYFDGADGQPAISLSGVSDDELRRKFRDNAAAAGRAAGLDELIDNLDRVEAMASVRELTDPLL